MFELPTFLSTQLRFNQAADNAGRSMNSLMSRYGRLLIILTLLLLTGAANARQDLILVLDNSGSMKKNDPEFLATNAVREFIDSLEGDIRAGMIIFDQRVELAVPLTQVEGDNKQLLIKSLDGINYRGQLTDSPAAVERAIYELKTNAREGVAKYIVFMTDGIVDTGNAAADVEKTKWLREELAVDAADNGIEVLAVAFTENADFFLIQSLAKKTNGDYFRALTAADLPGVFAEIQNRIVSTTVSKGPAKTTSPSTQPDATTSDGSSASEQANQAVESTVAADDEPADDASDLLAQISPEDLEALQEISEIEGIPIAQLAQELFGTGDANEQSGVVVSRPGESAADASDLLSQISPEDLEALQEISEIEGIPIEQLARELYGAGDANEQPGVVVSRPGEPAVLIEGNEPPALEQDMLYQLIAAAIGLLILVLLVVWLVRRKRKSNAAEGKADKAPQSVPAIEAPSAFLHDISGIASEPLVNLDANTLMVGRVAGTPDEHLKYLVINAPTVGRRHALIKYKDKSYWLQDQGSVNGTYVNDKRLSGECQLRHGDRLRFHNAEFEFTQPDTADAGETMIADALPGEETIVADATVMGTLAAAAGAGVAVASDGADGSNAVQESASDSGDDMFDEVPDVALDETLDSSDDARLDEPGIPADFAGEEITDEAQTSIDDIFDVTGDDIVPSELAGSEDGSANDSDDNVDDDDFSEDLTELNPDSAASEEIDESFDADASAFFDDNTVGPVVEGETGPDPTTTNFKADESGEAVEDDALFSVDGGDAHNLDQEALDERLERARALAEAEGEASPTPDQAGVDHLDTMLNMEAPPQEDPNDVTLDDFIETNTFKAPLTQMPDESSGEPEGVSLKKFVETSAMDANEVSETVIMNEPPTAGVEESKDSPGSDASDAAEIDDDASAFFDGEDDSEDPTEFK